MSSLSATKLRFSLIRLEANSLCVAIRANARTGCDISLTAQSLLDKKTEHVSPGSSLRCPRLPSSKIAEIGTKSFFRLTRTPNWVTTTATSPTFTTSIERVSHNAPGYPLYPRRKYTFKCGRCRTKSVIKFTSDKTAPNTAMPNVTHSIIIRAVSLMTTQYSLL